MQTLSNLRCLKCSFPQITLESSKLRVIFVRQRADSTVTLSRAWPGHLSLHYIPAYKGSALYNEYESCACKLSWNTLIIKPILVTLGCLAISLRRHNRPQHSYRPAAITDVSTQHKYTLSNNLAYRSDLVVEVKWS